MIAVDFAAAETAPLLLRTGLKARPLEVRRALGQAVAALRRAGVGEGQVQNFELAVAEALNNIVEHAYGGDDEGEIDLDVRLGPEVIVAVLRDFGAKVPSLDGAVPKPVPPGALPEGGFGLALIHDLAGEVILRRLGGETRLELRFERGTAWPETCRLHSQSTSPRKI